VLTLRSSTKLRHTSRLAFTARDESSETAAAETNTHTHLWTQKDVRALSRVATPERAEGQGGGLFKMGKTTPYFLFVGENRADVKAALLEAGEATSLGNVGKALGLKWKALTDEQREVRRDRHIGCRN